MSRSIPRSASPRSRAGSSTETGRRPARAAGLVLCLLAGVLAAASGGGEGPGFAEVVGERPSVYRRPTLDDRLLLGQARRGDVYPVLREVDVDLPRPFVQILFNGRAGWIYGNSVAPTDSRPSLSPAEQEAVERLKRSPEEAVGGGMRELLNLYNREAMRLAESYGLASLPTLGLAAGEPLALDHATGVLTVRLRAEGGGRLMLPRTDRFLLQMLVALALDEMEQVDGCRLILRLPAAGSEAEIEVSREGWENAVDLTPESFWERAAKRGADGLWSGG